MLFLPVLPVIIVKIPVNKNLAKKSCPFAPFYHSVVDVVYILVNENLAKRSYLLCTCTYIP